MRTKARISLNKRKLFFLLLSLAMAVLLVLVIPLDAFYHGFYCEPLEYAHISEEDKLGEIALDETGYTTTFSPEKKQFAGFEVYIVSSPEEEGQLLFSLYNEKGDLLESVEADTQTLPQGGWYIVNTEKTYSPGQVYTLSLTAKNSSPHLQLVDNAYLQDESLNNQLLVWYGYSNPTFLLGEKWILLLLCAGIWTLLLGELWLGESPRRKGTRTVALALSLMAVLNWNYLYNSFDQENSSRFPEFQDVSDALVMSMIEAEQTGVELSYNYGLGNLYNAKGYYYLTWKLDYLNDDNWTYGYSNTEPQITIAHNQGTYKAAKVGTVVQFDNGDSYEITQVENMGDRYVFTLDADEPLNYYKCGSLDRVTFQSPEGETITLGNLDPYLSQYGLQGKVFRHLARYLPASQLEDILWLVCTAPLALVLALLTVLVGRRYNPLMGACFGVTFLLSPWVVNFSNSVYWVEVTWFLPMLLGLVCAIGIQRRAIRVCSIAGAFLCVFVKSLCGYEYITTIMLGMIAFLLTDLALAWVQRDKKRCLLLLRTTFLLGLAALAGFFAAILVHASLRGDGNLLAGVKSILERDVLRRVGGGNLNDFESKIWPSLNASVWDTLRLYFHFSTDIIAGIDANLFPMLCVLPLVIFLYDYVKKQLDLQTVLLYVVFFLTSISWFVLGKSHSYIHTHMNFVLWYFGFVQICFYTIGRKLLQLAGKGRFGK